MSGEKLLLGLSYIDHKYIEESETDMPVRRPIVRKPLLIAALIAAVLLAGCGYAVLSGTAWFQSFFAQRKGQPLSQGQTDYIVQNTKEIGQSVTVGDYTVTLEAAIAEPRVAWLKLRLQGKEPFPESVSFVPRWWTSEEGKRMEDLFFKKGSSPKENGPYMRWSMICDDPVGDTVSVLIRIDQSHDASLPSFEAGTPYILHLTDLVRTDVAWGDEESMLAEGEWDFEIQFDHLNDEVVELISEPITISANDTSLTLTSLKLRTMSLEAAFEGTDPEDLRTMSLLAMSEVVLKDGTAVSFMPVNFNPSGSAGLSLDCPVDLKEVDYVRLRDGTKLPMPES